MSKIASHDAICVIDNFEACKLLAYRDSGNVPTIGWGHTNGVGSFRFKMGQRITQTQADAILHEDLQVFEAAIDKLVKVPLQQYEFDGLLPFVYNVGEPHFAGSTLLRRLNAGDRRGAAAQFMVWTRGGGRVLPGLVIRRRCEAALFAGNIHDAITLAVQHGGIPDKPDASITPDAPHADALAA